MSYRYLGRSGLKVSRLALGTMMFGGPTDEPTSHEIIARAKARGVNFIDTADVYQKGRTEVVGRAIRHDRDDWVLATKFANPLGGAPTTGARPASGSSRPWKAACAGWAPITSTSCTSTAPTSTPRWARRCAPSAT